MAAPEDMRDAHDISQKITTTPVALRKDELAFSRAGERRVRVLYLETAEGLVPERPRMIVAAIGQFHDSDEELPVSLR
jgi:hypothetical protein